LTHGENDKLPKALDEYQAVLACAGDIQAFTLLYKRWHPKLLRFAYRMTRDADAAQDVMQDAAMTMAKNIGKLKDPAKFSAWAYTIVRRRSADYIQRQIKDRNIKMRFQEEQALPLLNVADEALSLKQALARLMPEDQILLKLFYIDGMRGAEMSEAMGVPLGTVKSRLFTARGKLKIIYESHEKETQND